MDSEFLMMGIIYLIVTLIVVGGALLGLKWILRAVFGGCI